MNPNLHKQTEQHYSNSQVFPTQPAQIYRVPSMSSKLHTVNHEPSKEEEQPSQLYGHLSCKQNNGAG